MPSSWKGRNAPRASRKANHHLHRRAEPLSCCAREAFGSTNPNYDVLALSKAVCELNGWDLKQVPFYTGIPDQQDDPFWNHFWSGKLGVMGRQGVHVFSRSLPYRNQKIKLPNGQLHTFLSGGEKGIDVRIALDVIRLRIVENTTWRWFLVKTRIYPRWRRKFGQLLLNSCDGSGLPAHFLLVRLARTSVGLIRPIGLNYSHYL